MMKKMIALTCIFMFLLASQALAYKRDVPKQTPDETTTEEPQPETKEAQYEDYSYGGGHSGMVIAGYVFIALGSMAAIAGSTIIAATDNNLTGAIVSGSGAALGLTGSMLLVFGSHGSEYGVSPSVDPANKSYGLAFSGNF
jgi:hypothetical protein